MDRTTRGSIQSRASIFRPKTGSSAVLSTPALIGSHQPGGNPFGNRTPSPDPGSVFPSGVSGSGGLALRSPCPPPRKTDRPPGPAPCSPSPDPKRAHHAGFAASRGLASASGKFFSRPDCSLDLGGHELPSRRNRNVGLQHPPILILPKSVPYCRGISFAFSKPDLLAPGAARFRSRAYSGWKSARHLRAGALQASTMEGSRGNEPSSRTILSRKALELSYSTWIDVVRLVIQNLPRRRGRLEAGKIRTGERIFVFHDSKHSLYLSNPN